MLKDDTSMKFTLNYCIVFREKQTSILVYILNTLNAGSYPTGKLIVTVNRQCNSSVLTKEYNRVNINSDNTKRIYNLKITHKLIYLKNYVTI